jgi:hypothetical protein
MAVGAPSNVAISNNSTSDSLAYSFDASSDDSIFVSGDKYDMRYSTSADMSAASLNEGYINAGGSGNYSGTISGLSSGTTYYVQFRYTGTSGPSAWADQDRAGNAEDYAATDVGVPDAPGTPTVSAKTSTSITLTWSAVTGATGYKIYSGTGTGDPSGNEIDLGNVTTKQYTSLSVATTYSARVKAYNSAGTSGFGGTQTTDTLTATPVSPVLSDNKPTRNDIAWTAPTGTDRSYLVAGTSTNPTSVISTQSGTGAKTFEHTGLDPGDEYFYRVRTSTTYADGFYSSYSGNSSATNPIVDVPTSFGYTATSTTTITFNWTNPTYSERTYFYYPSPQYPVTNDDYVTGTTRLIGDGDLILGSAISIGQNSSYSLIAKNYYDGEYSAFTSTFTGYTLPGPPTSFAATANSYDEIGLSWTNPAGSALSETFTIQRKEGSGGTYADIATGETGTSYTDNNDGVGLSQSTEYYYQIKTVTSAGSSAYASEVSATTAAGPDPEAGDNLSLGKLGVATDDTSDDEDEISMGTASGGTSEVKMSDFFLGSLVAISGVSTLGLGAQSTYTVTRQNVGSEWTEQMKSVAANFDWSISNSNGIVSTNSGYQATITAAGGLGTSFVISCEYAGPFNVGHMSSGEEGEKAATPKTVTIVP